MENNEVQKDFYAGGFLYNPKTQSVLLHLRDDKTLVHPNQWAFFGGKNEGDESPKECFIRELREELGITVREEDTKYLCDYLNKDRDTWRHIFYIESEQDKLGMKLTEGADFNWIPLNEVFEYNLTEKTRRDLETFLRLREKI